MQFHSTDLVVCWPRRCPTVNRPHPELNLPRALFGSQKRRSQRGRQGYVHNACRTACYTPYKSMHVFPFAAQGHQRKLLPKVLHCPVSFNSNKMQNQPEIETQESEPRTFRTSMRWGSIKSALWPNASTDQRPNKPSKWDDSAQRRFEKALQPVSQYFKLSEQDLQRIIAMSHVKSTPLEFADGVRM